MPLDTTPQARDFAPGIGRAVADRTVARPVARPFKDTQFHEIELPRDDAHSLDDQVAAWAKANHFVYEGYHVKNGDDLSVKITVYVTGKMDRESWSEVADRVSLGNAALRPADFAREIVTLRDHLSRATLLMSGRHLQHGDASQPSRNMEVFTNCATSAASFLTFYLLLNGAGVGSDYSDEMVVADLNNMPIIVPVIRQDHPDVERGLIQGFMTREDALHLYGGRDIHEFRVPDSREGWGQGIEKIEAMAAAGTYRQSVLLLEFSDVRENGAPIGGMQNRPASGPGPLMGAINKVAKLRDAGMAPWRAKLYLDHYLAEVVLVGGARRAARMSTKWWKDAGVFEFIGVKAGGRFLWSSNNSITVDEEFWDLVAVAETTDDYASLSLLAKHAHTVFRAVMNAAFHDGTGEPGFINVHRLREIPEGLSDYADGLYAESERYKVTTGKDLLRQLGIAVQRMPYLQITNPCGEISLFILCGYCVIADVVPYHATDLDDAEDAFRTATRALIRVNTMDSLFKREVDRTNRIGVGFTGIFEFAFKFFGYGWRDLVDERISLDFWETMGRFSQAVKDEAHRYSAELGVPTPHTDTTVKPAGTTSKLFGLTEGAHLPAMLEYVRWVQFRNDDPLVAQYRERGFPTKRLKTYDGTTVVGFPTAPEIVKLATSLGLEHKIVTAAQATMEEQFEWLRLLEKWWIRGGAGYEDTGNQVSYTMKYDPTKVAFDDFVQVIRKNQSTVKCVSVMPQVDSTAYEYQPEQPVNKAEFERIARKIAEAARDGEEMIEEVDFAHVDCGSGGCPIDFLEGDKNEAA